MAYCRYGSNSDVYCYKSACGYLVHLAARRKKHDAPEYQGTPEGMFAWMQEYEDDIYTPVPSYDGRCDWLFATATECHEHLCELQRAGYKIPGYALERLAEEINE